MTFPRKGRLRMRDAAAPAIPSSHRAAEASTGGGLWRGLGQLAIIAAGLPAGGLAYVEARRIASIIRLSGRLDRGVEIRPELILAPGTNLRTPSRGLGL